MNSGVHEKNAYKCNDCDRTFANLTGLIDHCANTSCRYANNTAQTLVHDFTKGGPQQLMLTNGPEYTEATLHFSGNGRERGAGFVLVSTGRNLERTKIAILDTFITNEEAQLAALCWGLEAALKYNIHSLCVKGDSHFIIDAMNGGYGSAISQLNLIPLYDFASEKKSKFGGTVRFEIDSNNYDAGNLAHMGWRGDGEGRWLSTVKKLSTANKVTILQTLGANSSAKLRFDGSAKPNPGDGGAGFVLSDLKSGNTNVEVSIEIEDEDVTSNEAEFAALNWGLEEALKRNITSLSIEGDSKLVIDVLSGKKTLKSPRLIPFYKFAKSCLLQFDDRSFNWIPRENNKTANDLANLGSDSYRFASRRGRLDDVQSFSR